MRWRYKFLFPINTTPCFNLVLYTEKKILGKIVPPPQQRGVFYNPPKLCNKVSFGEL